MWMKDPQKGEKKKRKGPINKEVISKPTYC